MEPNCRKLHIERCMYECMMKYNLKFSGFRIQTMADRALVYVLSRKWRARSHCATFLPKSISWSTEISKGKLTLICFIRDIILPMIKKWHLLIPKLSIIYSWLLKLLLIACVDPVPQLMSQVLCLPKSLATQIPQVWSQVMARWASSNGNRFMIYWGYLKIFKSCNAF